MSQRSAFIAAASATADVSEPPRPERGEAAVGGDALEAGDDGDPALVEHALEHVGVDIVDQRRRRGREARIGSCQPM